MLACGLSGCTVLFDSGRAQCRTDEDCRGLGLRDGMCIENVCEPMPSSTSSTTNNTEMQPAMPSAGLGGGSTPNINNDSQMPSAGISGVDPNRGVDAGGPRRNNGSSDGPPEDDGGGIATGSSGRSAPGKACEGPNCECTADSDCSARVAGGRCVEGRCWEPETECTSDDECVMRGPEFVGGRCQDRQCEPNPKWRCDPPPPASANDMRELTLPVIDALALRYLADVPIVACNKLDYTCMNPIAMVTTNMDGEATMNVPANFAGYMQQLERTDYVPAMYFMPSLLPDDGRLSNFPLVPNGSFGGLALALGTSVDRSRGHAMLIIEDCQGLALAGIKFSTPQADMGTTEFYVIDQIPTTSASETPPEGDGGFANLPEGTVEITATEVKTGLIVNKVTMLIRPGMITTVYIKPASRGSTTTGRFPLGP